MCEQSYAESGPLLHIKPCEEFKKLQKEKEELQVKYDRAVNKIITLKHCLGQLPTYVDGE